MSTYEYVFVSLGVQKFSFRGTDKKVQKCTNVQHTLLKLKLIQKHIFSKLYY